CQPLWEQPGPDAGRRVIFQYNPLTHATAPGLLASVIQPATRDNAASTETLEYDGRGNVSAVMSALGIRVESVGDVVGRDTLTRQQITATAWEVTRRRFDVMGQDTLTESIGPALNGHPEQRLVVRKRFDAEGNLRSVLRQALPDTARVDTVVTRFQYDMAGRKVVEIAPDLKHDSTFYDPAGNVVRTRSRRGLQTWMRYDTLNRLDRRIVEEYAYAPATREVRLVQNNARVGGWTFPYYANAAGGMFAIAADTATYTYDRMSNLLAADNHDAQVRRSYALNGQLLTDTLRIRTWAELAAGGSFTAHQYVLSYGYDLNGRRTQLTHPLNVAPVNGNTGAAYTQQSYQYEPVRGALSRLTSVLGQHYDFFYNTQGQVDSIGYPGGNGEAMHYDADGRLASRSLASPGIYKPVGPMVIHNPVYTYGDRRGKPTLVSDAGDAEVGGSMTLKYSGLGMLVYSQGTMGAGRGASHTSEQYTYDALGNRVAALVAPATYTAVSTYQKYTGRLITTGPPTSVAFAPDAYSADANVSTYDLAGNAEWFQLDRHGGKNYGITRNYYGGDEKLRASERWTCTVSDVSYTNSTDFSAHCIQPSNLNSATGGAFEEYRYDALGRRIAVRSRREPYCTGASCASTLTRTVWDGDQILYEIRARGATGDAASTLENDAETGAHWGRVAYTHGSGIDRPLDLIRMGYTLQPNDNVNYGFNDFGGPYSIIPFRNWRGVVDAASTSNGRQVPCQSGTACPALIHLPGNSYQAWFSPSQPVARTTWFGSLIEEKLDNTGQMYMRNRYYNPATGRFTQEDPIGLAGGLNVYGFAEGDPVSYDDPFGLCPNPLGRGLGSLQCATQDVIEGAKRLPGALLRGTWRAAKEPLVQMLAFNAFPAARGALAGAARAARLGSAAQGAANAAQALRPRPGMAAAAEAATGELVTAVSGRGALHPTIQGYVDDGIAAGYRGYAGGCAEPRCASALLDAGARTEGAFVTTRGVGGVGSARHGAQFAPCENCAYVLRRAGMTYVP
ncbi:MAG TPA: RHS repeat-associated core domain-containing protein, partial [Longimicrobium sp.]|nr:RHS repeat-associated core domain-containing protein [Longimicrobium sp.]